MISNRLLLVVTLISVNILGMTESEAPVVSVIPVQDSSSVKQAEAQTSFVKPADFASTQQTSTFSNLCARFNQTKDKYSFNNTWNNKKIQAGFGFGLATIAAFGFTWKYSKNIDAQSHSLFKIAPAALKTAASYVNKNVLKASYTALKYTPAAIAAYFSMSNFYYSKKSKN